MHIRAIFDDALYLVIDSLATREVLGLAIDEVSQNANSEANPTSSNGGSNRNY